MKKPDLSRHVPPGYELKPELLVYGWGAVVAALYSLGYLFSLREAWRELFLWHRGLQEPIPGAVMEDFASILGHSLVGFPALALWALSFIAVHYRYHHRESKSIWLMRRLPDRRERHRRCLTVPLTAAALSLLLGFLMLLLYFVIYLAVTPAENLTPDQWQKLWSVKL